MDTFWYADFVAVISQNAFVERYRKWCKRHRYNFSKQKAIKIHTEAAEVPAGSQVRYLQATDEGKQKLYCWCLTGGWRNKISFLSQTII